jgi:hypothetical protein
MSQQSVITQAMGWHRFEHKSIEITVVDSAGDPQDLTGIALSWKLLRNGTALITKTTDAGITITGDDDNVATIDIDETEYVYDAEDGTSEVVAGVYRHELWDIDSDVLLSYGDAHLLPGTAPAEVA